MKYKTIVKNLEFQTEEVYALIEKLDSYDKINLYITSMGGDYDVYLIFMDYLNSREKDIILHPFGLMASCGALLLVDYKGKIIIDDEKLDFILFHNISRKVSLFRDDDLIPKELLVKKGIKTNKVVSKKVKKYLTKKQFIKFSEGKDVILTYKQFIKRYEKEN